MIASKTEGTASLLDRMLNADSQHPMSYETSRYILSLKFPQRDTDRTNELLAKNRSGNLSVEESDELDYLIDANCFLAALQTKARTLLNQGN